MRSAPRSLAALMVLQLPLLASAAGEGDLRVTVTPGMLRLAEGSRARVRVEAAGHAPPTLTASAGRVEGVREVSSGIYEAEYIPPNGLDPQVALVTAASGGAFGWASIQLAGVRDVVVNAPYRTFVRVEAGGNLFGPVPATPAGRAVVRVVVPPGVRFATYGSKRIDLGVQGHATSHVVLDPAVLDANTGGSVTIHALAVDEVGAPRGRVALRLLASEGAVSPPVETEPGVFEARWTLDPGQVHDAIVLAEVTGPRPSLAVATLERAPGPPSEVEVEVDRTSVIAGEDELNVTGRVLDLEGNPTEAQAKLMVSLGTGEAASILPDAVIEWHGSRGVYTGRVRVPRSRSGRRELELKMVAAGKGPLIGVRTVALLPGPPSELMVEPERDLLADGRAREIRVTVLDRHGNRVEPSDAPRVTATRGTLGAPSRGGAGVYLLEYSSPLAAKDFSDVIRARVGGIEQETVVRVRAKGGAVVLAPKVGYTVAKGLQSPEAGAELGFWTRSLDSSLGLVVEARLFTFSRADRLEVAGQALQVKSTATFASLEASLAWRRPLLHGMVWLGAGGGAVAISSRAETTGQADVTDRVWTPVAHASIGWGHPLGPAMPFGELKASYQADPARGPVQGSLESLTFNFGCRLDVL